MASEDFKINIVADTKHAIKSFKDLKDKVGDAGSGVSGSLAGIGVAAAAGGAAVLAFATKSVMAFGDLGLDVEKLHTATGIAVEDASRLIEVAGDIGISSETLSTGIGKMEKTLGKNADAFDKFGISVVKAKDGTVDANGTFLNAVEALNAIKDPTEKAAAGAEIFGKGWSSMSELIAQGGPELRKNLAAVDDAKIFDDKKVDDAKNLRAAFDSIKDAGENLMLTLGAKLAPIVVKLAPMFAKIVDQAGPLIDSIGTQLVEAFDALIPVLKIALDLLNLLIPKQAAWTDATGGALKALEALRPVIEKAGLNYEDLQLKLIHGEMTIDDVNTTLRNHGVVLRDAAENTGILSEAKAEQRAQAEMVNAVEKESTRQTELLADQVSIAAREVEALTRKYAILKGTLNIESERLKMHQDLSDLEQDAIDLWDATVKGSKDAGKMQEDYAQKVIATKQASLDLLEQSKVPIKQSLEVLALIDAGKYAEADALIAALTKPRIIDLIPQERPSPKGGRQAMAAGGIAKPGITLVGEQGPELVMMAGGENVLTASQTASAMAGGASPSMSGSGSTINLTVNAGLGTDGAAVGQQIVNMLKQYQRTNGPFDFTSR